MASTNKTKSLFAKLKRKLIYSVRLHELCPFSHRPSRARSPNFLPETGTENCTTKQGQQEHFLNGWRREKAGIGRTYSSGAKVPLCYWCKQKDAPIEAIKVLPRMQSKSIISHACFQFGCYHLWTELMAGTCAHIIFFISKGRAIKL